MRQICTEYSDSLGCQLGQCSGFSLVHAKCDFHIVTHFESALRPMQMQLNIV